MVMAMFAVAALEFAVFVVPSPIAAFVFFSVEFGAARVQPKPMLRTIKIAKSNNLTSIVNPGGPIQVPPGRRDERIQIVNRAVGE